MRSLHYSKEKSEGKASIFPNISVILPMVFTSWMVLPYVIFSGFWHHRI